MNKKQFEDGISEIIQIDDNLFQAFITYRKNEDCINIEKKADDIRAAGYVIDSIHPIENWIRFATK